MIDADNTEAKETSPGMAALRDDLNNIKARRWFGIRRALDMTSDEIMEDPVATMVVVAHERARRETNKDDWDRFLNLGMTELTEVCGLTEDEADDVVVTTKSE